MEGETILQEIINRLEASPSSIRCREMTQCLERLGFEVRNGKKQGHKVFVHHGVATFYSDAYTCGHGSNPEIKSIYVRKIIKLLKQYQAELIQYLGEIR